MIAPEGRIVIIPILIISMVGAVVLTFYHPVWLKSINIIIVIFIIFSLYFFRDPERKIMMDSENFYSPADGKVVRILEVNDPDVGLANQISIFLSIFNVHRQWVPYNGKVLKSQYNEGKFFGAFKHKASEKNEQFSTLFLLDNGLKIKVKQIAGFLARRIINYMSEGLNVIKGQSLGFIRFGSRVDIILPNKIDLNIKVGQKVIGCKTIIGKINEKN